MAEMKQIFTGKTIEDAKAQAVAAFGVSANQIVFRILQEPKGGFLGIGAKDAQVEATYEVIENASVAEPKTAPATPIVEATKTEVPVATEEKEEKVVTKTAPKNKPEKKMQERTPREENTEEVIGIESEKVEAILTDEDMSPNLLQAKKYIIEIYKHLGLDVTIEVQKTANGIRMELDSETRSGTIIGRRGETLDSIQYLASILVNRNSETYNRLLLDSNGYRERRRKTLEQLAEKIARNVLRSGRSTTLEPMNPYERRIIHSKIAGIEGVNSRSVGEDPYRKVVISSVNGRKSGGRGRNNGNSRGGYNNRRNNRERNPEDFKRKNLDSMKTSFERDYKKPKPEDELNAGLYGKIEF